MLIKIQAKFLFKIFCGFVLDFEALISRVDPSDSFHLRTLGMNGLSMLN